MTCLNIDYTCLFLSYTHLVLGCDTFGLRLSHVLSQTAGRDCPHRYRWLAELPAAVSLEDSDTSCLRLLYILSGPVTQVVFPYIITGGLPIFCHQLLAPVSLAHCNTFCLLYMLPVEHPPLSCCIACLNLSHVLLCPTIHCDPCHIELHILSQAMMHSDFGLLTHPVLCC